MIRLLGAVLLTGGAALLGLCAVRHMNSRVNDLRYLIQGVESMLRELTYRLAPLPELLQFAQTQTEGRVALFFDLCAQGAEHLNGRSFQTVWEQAAEASQMRLEQPDLQCLEQLGSVLGRYDGDSQRKALEAAAVRLEEQHSMAEEQSRRFGKVYSVLGLTAGAFLMILLI